LVDWNAFGTGGGIIPTACDGVATPAREGVPSLTTYDADYGAAKTIRASLGASKRFWNVWSLNLDAGYTYGIDQSASRDLNLNTAPVFTLSGEDSRPVYADPAMIVATTGAVPLAASRVNDEYGRVSYVTSGLENKTTQLTASVSTQTRRGASLRFSYSWMRSYDQGGSGGGGGGFGGGRGGVGGGFASSGSVATAGDPNEFLWARSSNDRTHNIQFNFTWPFSLAVEVSAVGRMTSGSRYTPIVQGDINGDGAQRNDIAYIYDPASASDPAVAAGMASLLSTLDGSARSCLESQLGRVAERNSCIGPWQPSLDLQVNWKPSFFANRLSMSFGTVNFLGGLDQLFHGSDNLSGWGQNARPDATLLQVEGFNPTTNQFQYVVNERFGASGGNATAVRSPFQVTLQGRLTVGFDRRQAAQRGFFGGGQQQSLAEQMLGRIDSISPHPAKVALERKDELALDARQLAALQLLADSSDAKLAPMVDTMRTVIEAGGTNPDIAKIFEVMGPIITVLREFQTTGLEAVRAILTDAQWALLPETTRNPDLRSNPFFGGGRGGQPGAGGGPGGRPGGGFGGGGGRRGGGPDGGDF
jgi:uncharacterized membrane protein YgcG